MGFVHGCQDIVLLSDQRSFGRMSRFVCRSHALIQTVFGHVLLQTSNHSHFDDLREEWVIRNRAVVADIGNVKALFLEQWFDDGIFMVEGNRSTSQ